MVAMLSVTASRQRSSVVASFAIEAAEAGPGVP